MGKTLWYILLLINLYAACTATASAQVSGVFDWSALGFADEDAIPSGTTHNSGTVTTTLTWSTVTDGGVFVPAFGNDFLSYESGTTGTISETAQMGFDNDSNDSDDKIIVDFAFSQAVQNVQFTLLDIDQRTFDDIVEVYYDTGSGLINARTGSFASLGVDVVEDDETFAQGWEGTVNVSNDSINGNAAFNFSTEQITAIRIIYFSGDDGTGADPSAQLLNISDITYQTVVPVSDLSLSKTVNNQFPNVGATVTYTLTVTNSGPEIATGVQILDLLPSGLSYISDNGGTAYNSTTGVWVLPGSLASGASTSLQISASVNATGSYINIAEVFAADLTDIDSTPNNSGTAPLEDDTGILTIFPGNSPPVCPAGTDLSVQTGFASAVEVATSVRNEIFALGALSLAGTAPPDGVAAELNFNTDSLVLDLDAKIPQDTFLTFSLARDGGTAGDAAQVEIFFSTDGTAFTSAGIYGAAPADFVSAGQDIIEYVTVGSPIAGAQFVAFETQNADDIFVDGVQYDHICTESVELVAAKTVSVIDSSGMDSLTCSTLPPPALNDNYALPGACIEYRIAVTHPGGSDATDIVIDDILPNNMTYAGASQSIFSGGTLRTTDTAMPPNTITCTSATTDCVVRLEGATLAAGQTGDIRIRMLIE